jgi:hypothetical protein
MMYVDVCLYFGKGDFVVVWLSGGEGASLDCFSNNLVEVISENLSGLCEISFFSSLFVKYMSTDNE